jgi:hypothetical protein
VNEPSLKLVVAWSDRRNLCTTVREVLREFVGEGEVLPLGDDETVVFTGESTAAIRDRLSPTLGEGDHLLVAEFEVWSSLGPGVDTRWLLARGH